MEEIEEIDYDDDHSRRIISLVVAISVIREDPLPENTCPLTGKQYLHD
jgi:hypothetical protein